MICASNKDLLVAIENGSFREDLYWRLKVVPIHLPALRDRREDIRDLAQHFLGRFALKNGRPRQSLSDAAATIRTAHQLPPP